MTDARPALAVRDEILQFIARPVYPYLVTTTRDLARRISARSSVSIATAFASA